MGLARSRGEAGESLAASYLELAGLEVVQRNVRLAGVEVDLLAADGATRVVVEVKVRGRGDYGGAAEAIDAGQRARLIRAARSLEGPAAPAVRIDVVAIEIEADGARVRHYRNAIAE
jgi:putative endonuclease